MAEMLENIYSLTNRKKACWKDVCCDQYLQSVRLFNEEISTECTLATRDQLLLKLSIIQKLFSDTNGNSCVRKLEFRNYLLNDFNLLEDLTMCHHSEDQILVYSASKAVSKVLGFLPLTSKNKVWFCSFLDFQTLDTKSSPWRVLYTLSVVTNLFHSYHSNKSCEEDAPDCTCVCQGTQDIPTCSSVKEMTAFIVSHVLNKIENLISNCLPFWQEFRNIEIICDSVASENDGDEFENGPFKTFCMEVHKREIGFCHLQLEFEDRFFALLSLLYEALKCVAAILHGQYTSDGTSSDILSSTTAKYRENVKDQLRKDSSKCLRMDSMNKHPMAQGLTDMLQCSEIPQQSPYLDIHDITSSITEFLKIFPLLVHCLHIKHLSQILFKKILDVMDQLLSFPKNNSTTKHSITYIEQCTEDTARSFISVFNCCVWENMPRCQGFIGFGGNNLLVTAETDSTKSCEYFDDGALRKMSLVLLQSMVLLGNWESRNVQTERRIAEMLLSWAEKLKSSPFRANKSQLKVHEDRKYSQKLELRDMLCELFAEQDDELVEVLSLLLQLYCKLQERTRSYTGTQEPNPEDRIQTICCEINPHTLFLSFLHTVCFDQSVILDFLVSSETTFLSYLISYLHCILNNWEAFVSSHNWERIDDYNKSPDFIIDNSEDKGEKDIFENLEKRISAEHREEPKLPLPLDSSFTGAKNEMMLNENLVENNCSFFKPCSTNSVNDNYKISIVDYDDDDDDSMSGDDDNDDDSDKNDDGDGDDDVSDNDDDDSDDGDGDDDDDIEDIMSGNDDNDDDDSDKNDDDGDDSKYNQTIYCMDDDGDSVDVCNDGKVNVDSKITCHDNVDQSGIDKDEVDYRGEHGSSKDENEIIHSAICSKEMHLNCYSDGTITDNPTFFLNVPTCSEMLQPAEELEAVPMSLENTMSVLIRLRLSIERIDTAGLFPFSPEPLLRLIHRVENIYDGC